MQHIKIFVSIWLQNNTFSISLECILPVVIIRIDYKFNYIAIKVVPLILILNLLDYFAHVVFSPADISLHSSETSVQLTWQLMNNNNVNININNPLL